MKLFLSILVIPFFLNPCPARANQPPNTNMQIASDQLGYFYLAEKKAKQDWISAAKTTEAFYPTKFELRTPATDAPGACAGLGKADRIGYFEFRDREGILRSTKYLICVGTSPDESLVIGKLGQVEDVKEMNLRHLAPLVEGGGEDENCDAATTTTQPLCMPAGYVVYHWDEPQITAINAPVSQIISTAINPVSSNCVNVTFRVQGEGYNEVLGNKAGCKSHGYLKFQVRLYGATSDPAPIDAVAAPNPAPSATAEAPVQLPGEPPALKPPPTGPATEHLQPPPAAGEVIPNGGAQAPSADTPPDAQRF